MDEVRDKRGEIMLRKMGDKAEEKGENLKKPHGSDGKAYFIVET